MAVEVTTSNNAKMIDTEAERASSSSSASFSVPVVGNVEFGGTWEHRQQSMAMFSCSIYFIVPMYLLCWILTISLLCINRVTAVIMTCYLGYIFLLDKSHTTGACRPYLRIFTTWWSHACDYLPLLLVKTANLDPKRRYVMGYHPHGIISVGFFCAFATDGARTLSLVPGDDDVKGDGCRGFSFLFPGIDRRLVTLRLSFMTPFLREYFLYMGAIDSSKETFRNNLSRPSTAVLVVVGGAAESMVVHNHGIDLVLEKRKGFVREAIMANACLVPVIAFGESDLYHIFEMDEPRWVARFQRFFKRATGVAIPIFQGRGLFLKDYGLMPVRTPVCVVVGAPIEPPDLQNHAAFRPEIDHDTDKPLNKDGAILLEWHRKYVSALQELYKSHADASWNRPGQQRRSSLKIVQ